ncbi:Nucleosomal histone H3-Lys79 methylase [Pleurotus ostreatus]|uniref:Histone-lysine N-methyltransferase, H3 lysine-79 specific n=1 Tax=Pleurotus ostreatus TaxID=5322 RepID=A0A8H7A290_PLEOS|nr:Nucleosomal histone H3-Lys79 methylase [Pleurotus ostreatus]KAF7437292.1 Nucleosomal histone H3-Lys79 methylase [Pleurotus ostreatus]KAJ8703186.1 Nucleosomal histone H3-Lys79 methylase [Pleurotus ostreatus]
MISSSARPSGSDLAFFSSSKAKSSKPVTPSVVVTTRRRLATRTPILATQPPARVAEIPTPILSSNMKKRKAPSAAKTLDGPSSLGVKRLKTEEQPRKRASSSSKASSRASSRQNTLPPSPEPIYRSSRSRSTSTFPHDEELASARQWVTAEEGTPGPTFWSSEAVVKRLMRTYVSYFRNPQDSNDRSFEPHPTDYPYAELEYPNSGAVERYILLQPKDKDHYNPILCLERTLTTIIECYLTPAQQTLFGTIPNDVLIESTSPPSSPASSPPSNPSLPLPSESDTYASTPPPKRTNLLRTLHRAIHLRDGPLFLQTLSSINDLLRKLKYPEPPSDPLPAAPQNAMMANAHGWTKLPKKVLMRLIEENYQRSVGPHVQSLKNYEAFSSTVYGELMPSLIYDIVQSTGLTEDSIFVDMGSGVGNVVVQASLQAGCKSFGVELMPAPAKIAERQWEQFKIRCRMWGLRAGDVELEKEDMLKSKKLVEYLPKADVVLVDNKVFDEALNEKLRPMFLDLKDGAIVVSLKPFSPVNARVTERNVDDMTGIFEVTERPYHSGSVSWGPSGGVYYIHRVDRAGYAKVKERFENSRTVRGSRRRC